MINHYFIFGDVDSREYGIWLSGPETANAPERDVETIDVPGRSGSLLIDNGRYMNTELSYTCAIVRGFEQRFAAFKNAMFLQRGYCRLEDTIHPEEYREAAFTGPLEPETTPYNRAGEFDIKFICKPQRYLKTGERTIELDESGTELINGGCPALPLITVYGEKEGNLTVGGVTVNFNSEFAGPLILDCDSQNAYYGAENKNSMINAPQFPAIPHGVSNVTWNGGIVKVEIIPRWWTL